MSLYPFTFSLTYVVELLSLTPAHVYGHLQGLSKTSWYQPVCVADALHSSTIDRGGADV